MVFFFYGIWSTGSWILIYGQGLFLYSTIRRRIIPHPRSRISHPVSRTSIMPRPEPDLDALITAITRVAERWRDPDHPARAEATAQTLAAPNRFTEEALAFAVNQQMSLLTPEALQAWIGSRRAAASRVVGVLHGGGVPLAGLQDGLAALLMGHRYLGGVSSSSPALLPAFVEAVRREAPALAASFASVEDVWTEAEALLLTTTDEAQAEAEARCARHGIPAERSLVRGHRYAVAVIDGLETATECDGFAEDALLHEGLGACNVALIWASQELPPDRYLGHFAAFRAVFPPHPDTPGVLAMQQAFLAARDLPHAYSDGLEFLLSKGEAEVQGPGHLRWVEYETLDAAADWLTRHREEISLVVARPQVASRLPAALPIEPPGEAHRPPLGGRSHGVDTLAFLASL